jgi:hypothetical protein
MDTKDQNEIKIIKNIQRSGLHRVAAREFMFPCVDVISWVLKHVDLDNLYIPNAKWDPITSFQEVDLEKYYHFEKGT